MNIIQENCGLLCNYEAVGAIVQSLKMRHDSKFESFANKLVNQSNITLASGTNLNPMFVIEFRNKISELGLGLTDAELIMMINNPPRLPIDLQVVIEDREERISDESVRKILAISNSCLAMQSAVISNSNQAPISIVTAATTMMSEVYEYEDTAPQALNDDDDDDI